MTALTGSSTEPWISPVVVTWAYAISLAQIAINPTKVKSENSLGCVVIGTPFWTGLRTWGSVLCAAIQYATLAFRALR
jgi:hypothetical protein